MDDLMNRSFKFDGRRSFSFETNKFTRSNTYHLASELGSSRFTPYEKLSDSMPLVEFESSCTYDRRSRNGAWGFVAKIFSLKKAAGDSSDRRHRSEGQERMSVSVRSSSWRPDPNCRWPVQGW